MAYYVTIFIPAADHGSCFSAALQQGGRPRGTPMKTRKISITLIAALVLMLTVSMSALSFAEDSVKKTSIKTLSSPEPGVMEVTAGTISGASGYEVKYSLNKSFKNAKTKNFTGGKLYRGKVKSLRAGKRYYVKVRAYKKVNGKKVYGKYSKLKTVKIASYTVGYTTEYILHVKTGTGKNASDVSIPYKSKVQVAGGLGKRAQDEWVKIKYKGKVYYKYMKKGTTYFTTKGITYSNYKNLGVGNVRQQVVTDAVNIYRYKKTTYVNTKDIEPGSTDSSGKMRFDCSGFTSYILNGVMTKYIPNYNVSNGINSQNNASWLYTGSSKFNVKTVCSTKGKPDFTKIKPGDLVFFDDSGAMDGKSDHVGIYIGNKEFVHSVNSVDGVIIMPMGSGRYYERFLCAKSFVPNSDPAPANKTMIVKKGATGYVYSDIKFKNKNNDKLSEGQEVKLLYETPCSWDSSKNCCYIEYTIPTSNERKTGYIQSTSLMDAQ